MRDRNAVSGSGMFLIELLLAILIFALASAICLKVFVTAYQISDRSKELNHAVVVAQNSAECFKATGGNLVDTAKLIGGEVINDNTLSLYFNSSWESASASNPDYLVEVKLNSRQDRYIPGEISAEVLVSDKEGGMIFSIPVSVMGVAQ